MNVATVTAICAAIAAGASAVSAFLAMRIQRDNLLTSVRPEIVLDGWARQELHRDDTKQDLITIDSNRNVGRGSALQCIVRVKEVLSDNRPVVIGPIMRFSVLAPNESKKISLEILIFWKNCKPGKSGDKLVPVKIQILTWDTHNRRHETLYSLTAFEGQNWVDGNSFAPGLMYSSRVTIIKPVWRLQLRGLLASAPVVGRMFREKQQVN